MNIIFDKYILEPESNRFNLYKQVTRTKEKTKEEYQDKQIMGFGIPFEGCLDHIITDMLAEGKEDLSIPTWIERYKILKDEITNIIK